MCRLCQFDRKGLEWFLDQDAEPDRWRGRGGELEEYFWQLQMSMGGHGNGVAALMPDLTVQTEKGRDYRTFAAADWVLARYDEGAISFSFHTRLASMGSQTDANCHPHVCSDTALMHNGHDMLAEQLAKRFGYHPDKDATDTAAIAFLCSMFGPAILKGMGGNFVGYWLGTPFQVVGDSYYDFCHVAMPNGGNLWGSESPTRQKLALTLCTVTDLNPATSWPTIWPSKIRAADVEGWTHVNGVWELEEQPRKGKKHKGPKRQPTATEEANARTLAEEYNELEQRAWEEMTGGDTRSPRLIE